jgi:hypothetical protein
MVIIGQVRPIQVFLCVAYVFCCYLYVFGFGGALHLEERALFRKSQVNLSSILENVSMGTPLRWLNWEADELATDGHADEEAAFRGWHELGKTCQIVAEKKWAGIPAVECKRLWKILAGQINILVPSQMKVALFNRLSAELLDQLFANNLPLRDYLDFNSAWCVNADNGQGASFNPLRPNLSGLDGSLKEKEAMCLAKMMSLCVSLLEAEDRCELLKTTISEVVVYFEAVETDEGNGHSDDCIDAILTAYLGVSQLFDRCTVNNVENLDRIMAVRKRKTSGANGGASYVDYSGLAAAIRKSPYYSKLKDDLDKILPKMRELLPIADASLETLKIASDAADGGRVRDALVEAAGIYKQMSILPLETSAFYVEALVKQWKAYWGSQIGVLKDAASTLVVRTSTRAKLTETLQSVQCFFEGSVGQFQAMEKELDEIERALFSEHVQGLFISALEERLNAPSESLLEPEACSQLCDASASLIAQYGVQSFEVMLHAAKVEQLATSFDVHIMSLTIPELATASAALDALSKLLSMLDMKGMSTVRYHARCWELCKPLSMALHSWDGLGDTMTSRYAKDANRGVACELLGLSAKLQALVSEKTDMITLPVNFKEHKEILDMLILSEVQPTNLEDINSKASMFDSLLRSRLKLPNYEF